MEALPSSKARTNRERMFKKQELPYFSYISKESKPAIPRME